jgi:hypothetical protein
MRSALACLLVLLSSALASAAYIGDAAFAGFPIEMTFNTPTSQGVFARALGDSTWKPLTLVGNQSTFTIHGQNTGLKFQLWNPSDSFYTQFDKLGLGAADNFNNTLHITEVSVDQQNLRKLYHFSASGPDVRPGAVNANSYRAIVPYSPPASVPEPATGILALLAIPVLRSMARRYS